MTNASSLLLLIFLFLHILCDYYFQTEKMVSNKNCQGGFCRAIKYNLLHATLHGISIGISFYLFANYFMICTSLQITKWSLYIFLFIMVSHFLIDFIKSYIERFFTGMHSFLLFIIDQVLHISILIISVIYIQEFTYYIIDFGKINKLIFLFSLLFGVFFLLKPSSIIIYLFLKSSGIGQGLNRIKITQSQLTKILYGKLNRQIEKNEGNGLYDFLPSYIKNSNFIVNLVSDGKADIHVGSGIKSPSAGRVIGYIERITIFLFLMYGSVTAVVAIIAMKTALRFSDLKDDNDSEKAEYIIIGSFLSILITTIISLSTRFIIEYYGFNVRTLS